MKKLLIISMSAGAGHVRAAEALKKTCQTMYPEILVEHIDMADYISLPFKKAVIDSYTLMVKRLPELWGFLYDKINSPKGADRLAKLTKQLKKMNSRKFLSFIGDFQPDKIVCTHFLPADVILANQKKIGNKAPVSIVMTDYDTHGLWFVPGVSYYFVATDKMKGKMLQQKICASTKIVVSGIPIDPSFYIVKNISDLNKKYHLNKKKKTVLVLSGGQGLAKSHQIVKTIAQVKTPLNIVAIAGKNNHLEKMLKKIICPKHINLLSIGWTDEIGDFMRLADVIVSKPGGITSTECMVLGKPLIIVDPIPGQEDHNADYIIANGFGTIARSPEDLQFYVQTHLKPSGRLAGIPAAETILNILNQ